LQFEKFIKSIPSSGALIYYAGDPILDSMVKRVNPECKVIPYEMPEHEAAENCIQLNWSNLNVSLSMLGPHNAANFVAAAEAARAYGLDEPSIINAATTFAGPSRRLEVAAQDEDFILIDDFAHAPSKVRASTEAVRKHFPDRIITAVLELHTFSSLRAEFLSEYKGALNAADRAYIYLNPEALRKKGKGVNEALVRKHFNHPDLMISQNITEITSDIQNKRPLPGVLLLMSSGNWGGQDWSDLATFVKQKKSNN